MSATTAFGAAIFSVGRTTAGTQQRGWAQRGRHSAPLNHRRPISRAANNDDESQSTPSEPEQPVQPKRRGRPPKSETLDLVEPELKRGRPQNSSDGLHQRMNFLNSDVGLGSTMGGSVRDMDLSMDMDDILDPLADDTDMWYDVAPVAKMEITAPEGSIQEKIQRVLSDQPKDPEIYGDREMIQLELYVKNGGGNRYNLVRGVAARARLEEEQQIHSPTALGDATKAIDRAICNIADEMDKNGGSLSDVRVSYPPQYFKRYMK